MNRFLEGNGLLAALLLSTLPLSVGLLWARGRNRRAAVSSLLLRATLMATIAVAIAPILPLHLPRPSWLPLPQPQPTAPLNFRSLRPRADGEKISSAPPVNAQISNHDATPFDAPNAAPPSTEALSKYLKENATTRNFDVRAFYRAAVKAELTELAQAPSKYFKEAAITCAYRIWALGAIGMLGWLMWCHGRVAVLRRKGNLIGSGDAFERTQRIAASWSVRAPQLWRSDATETPFVCGVWRASICLPSWWPHGVKEAQQQSILRHEIAHCRRRDCTWNALALLMRALLWPQPLSWILCREMLRNSEDVCDEAALEGAAEDVAPREYARCLLDLSQRLSSPAAERAVRIAGAGARPTKSELGRRVRRILTNSQRDAWRLSARTRLAAASGIVVVVLGALLITGETATGEETGNATKVLSGAVQVDLSSPQATLDSFVAALNAGDANALVRCVRTSNSAADIAEFIRPTTVPMIAKVSVWSIDAAPGRATAIAQVSLSRGAIGLTEQKTALHLTKTPSGWQITPDYWLSERPDSVARMAQMIAHPLLAQMRKWVGAHGEAVLEGKVLLADGTPAAGALVRLEIPVYERSRVPWMKGGMEMYDLILLPGFTPQKARKIINQRVVTGADGSYRMEGLANITYVLVAFWPKVDLKTENGGPQRLGRIVQTPEADAQQVAPTQIVTAREKATTQAPDLKLQATARLEVRVVDDATQQPLSDVYVSTNSVLARPPELNSAVKNTDDNGRAHFNVLPGEIRVAIGGQMSRNPKGYFITRTPHGVYYINRRARVQVEDKAPIVFDGATIISCTPDQPRIVTIRLVKYRYVAPPKPKAPPKPFLKIPRDGRGTAVLTGKVLYEDGRPAAGVRVWARMQQAAQWDVMRSLGVAMGRFDREPARSRWKKIEAAISTGDTTKADGSFRLRGLITAPYDLMTAAPRGSQPRWPNAGTIGDYLSPAVIGVWAHDGKTTPRTTPIRLIHGALIRGRVVDRKSGAGLGGIFVACYGPHRPRSSDSVSSARTNPDGSFTLRLAPGDNQLYIAGPANNALSGHTRFADDPAENARRSIRQDVYVINTARGPYEGSATRFQIDGDAAWHETKSPGDEIKIALQNNQTRALEIQLRRLRPVTPAEEENPESATNLAAKPRASAPKKTRVSVPPVGHQRGVLTGKVLYEDGRPAADVVVRALMRGKQQSDFWRQAQLVTSRFNREPQRSNWLKTGGLLEAVAATDEQGRFRIEGLSTVPYNLITNPRDAKSGIDARDTSDYVNDITRGVRVRDEQTTHLSRPIVLKRGALIYGRVVDAQSGVGLGGVLVDCGCYPNSYYRGRSIVQSRPDGGFTLRVPTGENRLHISGSALAGDKQFLKLRFADNNSKASVFVLTTSRGLYAGPPVEYDSKGRWHWSMKIIEPPKATLQIQKGETRSVELKLRRLRRATPAEAKQ